jgi:GAF domain-containing protein
LSFLIQKILSHPDTHFGLARYIEASPEVEERWANFHETINCFPESEAPFLCKTSRNKTLCSYVSVLEKTFVVHDIYKDTSFEWVEKIGGPRFYCGSPIMVNGRMVASLCVLDFRERPVSVTKYHVMLSVQDLSLTGKRPCETLTI